MAVASTVTMVSALVVGLAEPAARADVAVLGPPLRPAKPVIVPLAAHRVQGSVQLADGLRDWHGSLSHLAGTAHYDHGEWIYEDYPFSAYGAASPATVAYLNSVGLLAPTVPGGWRVGSLYNIFVQPQSGAGPFVPAADVSQLRLTVRGSQAYVLARTTTMLAPSRTALLLLFDTGPPHVPLTVPFGSGLHTSRASVAALVTPWGSRVVDLRTGRVVARSPAVADPTGYVNSLESRLPLSLISDHHHRRIRMVAGVGIALPHRQVFLPGGAAGPIAKIVPRIGMPAQGVYDTAQALALASHDIDAFTTTISVPDLRRGRSQRLQPGIGYNVRTLTEQRRISREGDISGRLQQYGLYLPEGYRSGDERPATLLLRGSGYTANSHALITPGMYQQLGDRNHAIVISPGARTGLSLFEGAAYVDVDDVLANAERSLPIDPARISVAGYSMGGFGAYLFAETQPDRFAAAFSVEGVVDTGDETVSTNSGMELPDVRSEFANLRYVPVEVYQGDIDTNVPLPSGMHVADRLRQLGYRYRLDIFPAHTHYSAGIADDFTMGQRLLNSARLTRHPAIVTFTRDMGFERQIDRAAHSSEPLIGHSVGLRFNGAWYVDDLVAANRRDGVATATVRTFARRADSVHPVPSAGIEAGHNGEVPSAYEAQAWRVSPGTSRPRNAMSARVTGARRLALDLVGMNLTLRRPMRTTVVTSHTMLLQLRGPKLSCVSLSLNGARPTLSGARTVSARLPAGRTVVRVRPASGCIGHR